MEIRDYKRRVAVVAMATILIGGIATCYITMRSFYQTHCLPNTYIGNTNVSGWSEQDIKSYYESSSQNRTLVLHGRDADCSVSLSDADFKIKLKDDIDKMISSQNANVWFMSYFSDRQYDDAVTSEYDEERLQNLIEALPVFTDKNIQAPSDATLKAGKNGFEIVKEVEGNKLDEKMLLKHIDSILSDGKALLASKDISVDMTDDYLKPSVYSDDESLKKMLAEIDKIQTLKFNLDLVDATEVIDKDEIASFLKIDGDKISYDEDSIGNYVTSLAKKYTTLHSTRNFKTSKGDVIQLQSNDDSYGFVFDKPATVKTILDALKAGKNADLKVSWNENYCVPTVRNSEQGDIGNTYVEVSIDQQHMWFYKDGKLIIDTDVVTGKDVDGRRTPKGVYFVWNKESPSMLKGSYGSQKVNFWMAFSWDGCGIHDSTWRSNYGGDIWRSSGSHGCVNTPYQNVEIIYNNIDYKTPVVVYER